MHRAMLCLGKDDWPNPPSDGAWAGEGGPVIDFDHAAYNLTRLRSLVALRPQVA